MNDRRKGEVSTVRRCPQGRRGDVLRDTVDVHRDRGVFQRDRGKKCLQGQKWYP